MIYDSSGELIEYRYYLGMEGFISHTKVPIEKYSAKLDDYMTYYTKIDKKNNYILGMIDIRHCLNDFLLQAGGHIGCGVRKFERKKGYAKQMIKLALEKCKKLKIEKVLITCNEDNIASEKSIISCGGILEDIRTVDGKNYKRFWIKL